MFVPRCSQSLVNLFCAAAVAAGVEQTNPPFKSSNVAKHYGSLGLVALGRCFMFRLSAFGDSCSFHFWLTKDDIERQPSGTIRHRSTCPFASCDGMATDQGPTDRSLGPETKVSIYIDVT